MKSPRITPIHDVNCPLCNLKEVPYYEDDFISVVRTKNMKGHQERLMVVWKEHLVNLPSYQEAYAIMRLIEVGKKQFYYTPKFILMEGTFQSIKSHWHIVATDLNPESDDFRQILKTSWIEVIDVEMTD